MNKKLLQAEKNLDDAFKNYGRNSKEYQNAYDKYSKYSERKTLRPFKVLLGTTVVIGLGIGSFYYLNKDNINNSSSSQLEQKLDTETAQKGPTTSAN